MNKINNFDQNTLDSFGDEWSRFDQTELFDQEAEQIFNDYFSIFPWEKLSPNVVGFDMGCGSGRWAKLVAPRVGKLNCIDPSEAIEIAKIKLLDFKNISFHKLSVDDFFADIESQDFGYSLGVLHHVPNTQEALISCVRFLKTGSPFLLYIYYSFDNRNNLFRTIWKLSDLMRKIVIKFNPKIKNLITDIFALLAYYPLAKISIIFEKCGIEVNDIPLSYYRNCSFYTMRTDARDRFGTPLEHRYSKNQIKEMMTNAGLHNIIFSEKPPFWVALGYKK